MSLKCKLLIAAASAALAVPAGAQVTGTRLPAPADVQAEVRTDVQAEASAPDAGAEVQADTQADVQADVQADAATESEPQAEAAPAADAQADAETQGGDDAGPVALATAADIRAGVTVQDPQGGVVGTIESVAADGAVVSTGSARAKLPLESFGKNARGLVISLTRAELEAAAAAAVQNPS